MPESASANEVEKDIPSGNAPLVQNDANHLKPTDLGSASSAASSASTLCGVDPRTAQTYPFNPNIGQPCTGYAEERVMIRQPAYVGAQAAPHPPRQALRNSEPQLHTSASRKR